MRRQVILLGVLALLILLRGSTLWGCALGNFGMFSLRNALLWETTWLGSPQPASYRIYGILPWERVESSIITFRHAIALDHSSATIRWGLGRSELAAGDAKTATATLEPLIDQARYNPILYHDILIAFSYGEKPDQAIALYKSIPPLYPQHTISDTVSVAYLEVGGQESLRAVKHLRPGDLYANYHLWWKAQQSRDLTGATTYSESLVYFPLEAIYFFDERLLDYTAQVIPALIDEGLWNRDKALNVVSFLTWQYYRAGAVERLLERLSERYPTEPDWLFYLAELYHRRGDLKRAETIYQQVLAMDAEYTLAYLRLGMVAEAEYRGANSDFPNQLIGAAKWYEQYHERCPDDLFGLKRLTEVYEILGKPEASRLRTKLDLKTDDRPGVAALLEVPLESVTLGPNLVENGGFEEWVSERPKYWKWSAMFNKEPFNAATFVGGPDGLSPFEGRRTARIDGFWVQQQREQDKARAGFWYWDEEKMGLRPIILRTYTPYVLSFAYRTRKGPDSQATVWVSNKDSDVFWSGGDHSLPDTGGMWYRVIIVGWNRSRAEAAIYPLVRSYAPGSVEFDDVQLRAIWLKDGLVVDPSKTWLQVVGPKD